MNDISKLIKFTTCIWNFSMIAEHLVIDKKYREIVLIIFSIPKFFLILSKLLEHFRLLNNFALNF